MPVCVLEEVECGLKAVRSICHLNLSSISDSAFNFSQFFSLAVVFVVAIYSENE
jgi:hypothetical protein